MGTGGGERDATGISKKKKKKKWKKKKKKRSCNECSWQNLQKFQKNKSYSGYLPRRETPQTRGGVNMNWRMTENFVLKTGSKPGCPASHMNQVLVAENMLKPNWEGAGTWGGQHWDERGGNKDPSWCVWWMSKWIMEQDPSDVNGEGIRHVKGVIGRLGFTRCENVMLTKAWGRTDTGRWGQWCVGCGGTDRENRMCRINARGGDV